MQLWPRKRENKKCCGSCGSGSILPYFRLTHAETYKVLINKQDNFFVLNLRGEKHELLKLRSFKKSLNTRIDARVGSGIRKRLRISLRLLLGNAD
jgi:hypothetical protein